MDSKELYIATTHLSGKMTWDKEWTYFGDGDAEIKSEVVRELIDNFLADEFLNLVHGRRNSGRFERNDVNTKMKALLMKENFQIWNDDLTKVVSFRKMGVLISGRK